MSSNEQKDIEEQQARILRAKLVDYLKSQNLILSSRVEEAFRTVPRHLFLPAFDIEQVYSDVAIVTHTQDEEAISSSSQPAIMAIMLEMLDIQPGQRVLEVGAGTGYNSALLSYLVGEEGQVTTVDIDNEIVEEARTHLQSAGYSQVQVIGHNGFDGYQANAPYDRIIVTARTIDVAKAWYQQLKPGGRLVLPLKLTGMRMPNWLLSDQILLALELHNDHFVAVANSFCTFMPLRGEFPQSLDYQTELIAGEDLTVMTLVPVTGNALNALLQEAYVDELLPIQMTHLELLGFRIWLSLSDAAFCEIAGTSEALSYERLPRLLRTPGTTTRSIGLYDSTSACFLVEASEELQSSDENTATSAFAVRGFGRGARSLVLRLSSCSLAWEQAGRPFQWGARGLADGLQIRIYPQSAAYRPSPREMVVLRPDSHIILRW